MEFIIKNHIGKKYIIKPGVAGIFLYSGDKLIGHLCTSQLLRALEK